MIEKQQRGIQWIRRVALNNYDDNNNNNNNNNSNINIQILNLRSAPE
jgi:hypothetical protein